MDARATGVCALPEAEEAVETAFAAELPAAAPDVLLVIAIGGAVLGLSLLRKSSLDSRVSDDEEREAVSLVALDVELASEAESVLLSSPESWLPDDLPSEGPPDTSSWSPSSSSSANADGMECNSTSPMSHMAEILLNPKGPLFFP